MNKSRLCVCRPVAICAKAGNLTFNQRSAGQTSWCLVKIVIKLSLVLSAACFPFAQWDDGHET